MHMGWDTNKFWIPKGQWILHDITDQEGQVADYGPKPGSYLERFCELSGEWGVSSKPSKNLEHWNKTSDLLLFKKNFVS